MGKALLANCIAPSELGKVLAFASMLDNFFPVVVTQAFSSIWKASNETHPGAAYLFAAGLTLVSVSCAAITHLHLRGRNLYDKELHEGQAEVNGNVSEMTESIVEVAMDDVENVANHI